jgi:hypothetical protein
MTRLQRWVESGALRRHRPSQREIADLFAVVDRDLRDAAVRAVSLDRRFATAYSAVLALATIVLAASGYRAVAQRGHHAVALQSLSELMGDEVAELVVYFDSCRMLRNASDYDRAGSVSASDVDELTQEALQFRRRVHEWLASKHPGLASAAAGEEGADLSR